MIEVGVINDIIAEEFVSSKCFFCVKENIGMS